MRECPVCGVAVKLANLKRHVANVHPTERSSLALSEEERRVLRAERRKSGPGFRVERSSLLIVTVISLTAALVVVGIALYPRPIHWHPRLQITIDGQPVTIPANIGIDPNLWRDHSLDSYSSMHDMPDGMQGMAPLHTHDTSGKIHVESRVTRDYTLGEFFRIWGQTFDAQQVLGHAAQAGHRVWMVVDGSTMSPSYSVVLRDQMHIQIVCALG